MTDAPDGRIDPRAAIAAIRAATPILGRPPASAFGDDLGGDDLAAVASSGIMQARAQQWRLIIPSRFQWAELAHFADEAPDVLAELTGWAEKPDGRNLVILGPVGTGKTHAGTAALRPSHDRGLEVRFYPMVELLDGLRPGAHDPIDLTDLALIDRLFIDDLGGEKVTDWTTERLYALINRRWLEELPTVVTSNLEPAQLTEVIGERTYSRLVGDDAVVIRLSGRDRRIDRG